MTATIGVDVGGTSTRVALVDHDAAALTSGCSVLACETESTLSFSGYAALLRWIAEVTDALSAQAGSRASAMGLAVPGILDAARTRVVRSVNVPMLDGREIGRHLAGLTGRQVLLVTDADAATWGEWAVIRPAPRRFAHLRLGTGVACGVVVEESLRTLEREPGRHADVLVIDRGKDAKECPCGGRGCLEAYASGAALARELSKLGYASSLELLRTHGDGEPEELRSLRDRAVTAVGTAIENLVRRYDIEAVVLSGGVLEAAPELFDSIADRHRVTRAGGCTSAKTPIRRAVLGDGAGVIGAALLVRAAPTSASDPVVLPNSY